MTDLVWLGPFLSAVTEGGLVRSEDVGNHWAALTEVRFEATPGRILFPLAPAAGNEVFLGTAAGIRHSTDGGLHWEPATLATERVLSLATFPQLPALKPAKKK